MVLAASPRLSALAPGKRPRFTPSGGGKTTLLGLAPGVSSAVGTVLLAGGEVPSFLAPHVLDSRTAF